MVVEDLAALLDAATVPTPYVLVGQSVGGNQAWLFADRHPEGVAGLLIMYAGFFELDWDELEGALTDEEIAGERRSRSKTSAHFCRRQHRPTTSPTP